MVKRSTSPGCATTSVASTRIPRASARRDRLAKFTKPDNAKRRASDIADRMREETELASVLPRTVAHVLTISDQVSSQCKDQREDMFRNRVERVMPNIDHSNSILPAVQLIDNV